MNQLNDVSDLEYSKSIKKDFKKFDNILQKYFDINNFENENVHIIYNKIAKHFDTTRIIIWPKVQEFINNFKKNSIILDIGCGNGKNMGHRKDCKYIGIDICENLLKQTKKQDNCEYILSNCLDIPISDNSIDYIMSIAVIHHLSTTNRRTASINEIYRLLKIGGTALIYVWAKEQPKFKNEEKQDVLVKWDLQKKYSDLNKDETLYRYYHLFTKNELETLIYNNDGIKIIENGFQSNNWYCIIEKYS